MGYWVVHLVVRNSPRLSTSPELPNKSQKRKMKMLPGNLTASLNKAQVTQECKIT